MNMYQAAFSFEDARVEAGKWRGWESACANGYWQLDVAVQGPHQVVLFSIKVK
jgi:hypothetical protein